MIIRMTGSLSKCPGISFGMDEIGKGLETKDSSCGSLRKEEMRMYN